MQKKLGLTDQALTLLEQEARNLENQLLDETEIKQLLIKEGCPTDHPIVAFQLSFAGYVCPTGYGNRLRLGTGKRPLIYEEEGHWFCQFALFEPNNAPAELVMDECGAIYWNENPVPLASSIQIFIESSAMTKILNSRQDMKYSVGGEKALEIKSIDIPVLHKRLTQLGLTTVEEATDAFEQWWVAEDSMVHGFKVWSSEGLESAIVVAANSVERLEELGTAFVGLADFPTSDKFWRNPAKTN